VHDPKVNRLGNHNRIDRFFEAMTFGYRAVAIPDRRQQADEPSNFDCPQRQSFNP